MNPALEQALIQYASWFAWPFPAIYTILAIIGLTTFTIVVINPKTRNDPAFIVAPLLVGCLSGVVAFAAHIQFNMEVVALRGVLQSETWEVRDARISPSGELKRYTLVVPTTEKQIEVLGRPVTAKTLTLEVVVQDNLLKILNSNAELVGILQKKIEVAQH